MISKVSQIIKPVYMVGGSVRDMVMDNEPKDYDFATPLSPDEVEQLIHDAGKRAYNIGKKFGTVGMKLDGDLVEVTTFRHESYTAGSRKPNVEFITDLTADLSRRDFTINAMALDSNQKIIDPYGGKLDILQRVIRCVGKPKERFKEDPLRLLRAARFVAQLNFEIDQDTEAYMHKMASSILGVSRERWVMEMDKLLMSDNPDKGLEVLWRTGLMNFMFPELALQWHYDQNSPYHNHSLHHHTALVVKNVSKDVTIRWAALLHDAGKPFVAKKKKDKDQTNYIDHEVLSAHIALKYGRYLNWSNERRDQVVELVTNHANENSPLREADKKAHL